MLACCPAAHLSEAPELLVDMLCISGHNKLANRAESSTEYAQRPKRRVSRKQ